MIVQFAGHGERIGSLTEPRNRNRRQYGENRHDPPFTPRPSQHLYVSHEISLSAAAATSAGPLPVPHQWPATLSFCVFQSKILHYLIVSTLPISVPISPRKLQTPPLRFGCRPAAVSL